MRELTPAQLSGAMEEWLQTTGLTPLQVKLIEKLRDAGKAGWSEFDRVRKEILQAFYRDLYHAARLARAQGLCEKFPAP